MNDLILLVADNDMEQALRGLLEQRTNALRINTIDFEIHRHPNRDSGCYSSADEFLRPFINKSNYVMVIFDHHGSGQENRDRADVENEVEEILSRNGWPDRNCVIAIEPEFENWIWVQSPELESIVEWNDQNIRLYDWLNRNVNLTTINKPENPKETFEKILRITRKPRSARIYRSIAETVTLQNCIDESFLKFRNALQDWFSD